MLVFGMGVARSERERRRQRAFGYRDVSKRRGAAGGMRRRRSGIQARRKAQAPPARRRGKGRGARI